MACFCGSGKSSIELLPVADTIATVLTGDRRITGVALSGSVARCEDHCHDIDLVIFHDGTLQDTTLRTSQRDSTEVIASVVSDRIARAACYISDDTPVSYFFLHEKVLWECKYLQSLSGGERFPGFYRTVFSQTPLYLLSVGREIGGSLQRFVYGIAVSELCDPQEYSCRGIPIQHWCGSKECAPVAPWSDIHVQILERKKERRVFTSPPYGGPIVDIGEDDDS